MIGQLDIAEEAAKAAAPRTLQFHVSGLPKPGGSKKGFIYKSKATGKQRVAMVDDCDRNADWRADVKGAAEKAFGKAELFDGALLLQVVFILPRPNSHYRGGDRARGLRPDAPKYHTKAPDTTKLLRSTEDALKGVVWTDDSRIAQQFAEKRFSDDGRTGATITIQRLENVR
jgi:Holliday junction resolvase RusA-like endonuclease